LTISDINTHCHASESSGYCAITVSSRLIYALDNHRLSRWQQDEAAPKAPPSAQGTVAGPTDVGQGAPAPQAAAGAPQQGSDGRPQQRSRAPAQPNPLRSLGDALEHWRASLAVSSDAPQVLCCRYAVTLLHVTLNSDMSRRNSSSNNAVDKSSAAAHSLSGELFSSNQELTWFSIATVAE
jgi:hypothetical protein